jgi:hypothetical protein
VPIVVLTRSGAVWADDFYVEDMDREVNIEFVGVDFFCCWALHLLSNLIHSPMNVSNISRVSWEISRSFTSSLSPCLDPKSEPVHPIVELPLS